MAGMLPGLLGALRGFWVSLLHQGLAVQNFSRYYQLSEDKTDTLVCSGNILRIDVCMASDDSYLT